MKKRFALIGENISYSLSPIVHKIIYEKYGIDATFELISLSAEQLVNSRGELLKLNGFNVTKPHKISITNLLDENMSGLEAVNTVVNDNGKLIGHNTDGFGFTKHFTERMNSCEGKRALIIGAGGVTRVIAPMLKILGAKVYVKNRSLSHAEALCAEFGLTLYNGEPVEIAVNCTTLGHSSGENPAKDVNLSKLEFAYDTIYNPPKTEFLEAAEKVGAMTENGFKMLVYQALKADEYMCNIKAEEGDYQLLYEAVKKELEK